MANFQDIKGFNVQSKSTDPTPYAQALVDNPYAGSWASGGTKNTIMNDGAGAGSNTAGLAFGGAAPPGTTADTETYNGTSWTEVNNLQTAKRSQSGTGSQTAALCIAGGEAPNFTADVEKWNGTSWTEINNLNLARGYAPGSSGTTTAALCFGGACNTPSPNVVTALTESFDGTSWTEVNDLNTARKNGAGAGVQPSSLYAGGTTGPTAAVAVNELWNGTSWTEASDLNTARNGLGGTGDTNTSVLVFGGNTGSETNKTESWNGTSWTEVADLAAPSEDFASSATGGATSALRASGNVSGVRSGATESWAFTGLPPSTPAVGYSDSIVGDMYYNTTTGQFKAIKSGGAPIGTWASGGTMNTDERYFSGGAGTRTAAIGFGGQAPKTANTELYDGTSWTEVNNLSAAKSYVGSAGTQTAALCIGGDKGPGGGTDEVEQWNGTSWTETTEINRAVYSGNSACGTTTAALITMAYPSPYSLTELWNGSSWTEVNDMNNAREGGAVAGISTSSIAAGGATVDNAETWDGTSWTEVSEINTARQSLGSSGAVNTSAIIFAGNRPGGSPSLPGNASSPYTESWDGTSWTEIADLGTARYGGGSSRSGGTSSSAHAAGGYSGTAYTGVTETFTAADFEIKTVTTS